MNLTFPMQNAEFHVLHLRKTEFSMRLFHFSDNPDITVFRPRPLRVHVDRPAGQEWQNGSLIWATDEAYEFLYLFPRECPRIVFWPLAETTREERELWMGHETSSSAVACIEQTWLSQFNLLQVFWDELPTECFSSLPDELTERNISFRVMDRLTPLKSIWQSTLYASGIRLRNAQDWGKLGRTTQNQAVRLLYDATIAVGLITYYGVDMNYVSEMRSIIGHRMLLLAGANVIIGRGDGHILLQQRTDSTWGLPGGLLEPGESLEETAIREVKEETSIDIHSLNFLKIFSGKDYSFILHNRDEINVITALYFTDNWSGDLVNDPKEGLALEFFSASQLPSPMNNEYVTYINYFMNCYS